MGDLADLELVLRSRVPVVIVETHEENRAVDLFKRLAIPLNMPVFLWTVTEGLRRVDLDYGAQTGTAEPTAVLRHIKATPIDGVYLLLDFHPYLDDPVNVRLMKEISHQHTAAPRTLALISHALTLPPDLHKLAARFELSLPDGDKLRQIVQEEAFGWSRQNGNRKVKTDTATLALLVRNLSGLSASDARRLARKAIFDDGAITESDLPAAMKAKYELLNREGLLSFEYETERFADVAGLSRVKRWLELRRDGFLGTAPRPGLAPPKGMLLLGVQGCGKSLVAKATAGVFGVPLLRLDFGVLYNKFFGESERNLREALRTAEVMAPCVLWIDEIEKGISVGDNDGGTSHRVLGTLLTWMAERQGAVFLVATANDIERLPPELVRKGRFDEIFFVDLPDAEARKTIFRIHLGKRGQDPSGFDLALLVGSSEGFSGAEIEQAIVSALYTAHGDGGPLRTEDVLRELQATRPLSVVMAEQIQYLRDWARDRTVPAG